MAGNLDGHRVIKYAIDFTLGAKKCRFMRRELAINFLE